MQFYCSEQMQNRELNTCKQDIYSFLHFLLPTNTEPCEKVRRFLYRELPYRTRSERPMRSTVVDLMPFRRQMFVTVVP